MDTLKALLILGGGLALIVGILIWGGMHSSERRAAESHARIIAAHEKNIQTPDGYLKYKMTSRLSLEYDGMYGDGQVHLKGTISNNGDKDLAKINLRISYLTKARPGESRPEFVKLGRLKAGQTETYDRILYTMVKPYYGVNYKLNIANIAFASDK